MKSLLMAALVVAALAVPAAADPNPQLVASVQTGLAHYGLFPDVSKFATPTVARLHLTLHGTEDYIDTLQELRAILRTAKFK